MSRNTHTEDLHDVLEGDSMTIETTDGHYLERVECTERTGREMYSDKNLNIKTWRFRTDSTNMEVSIIGILSTETDRDTYFHREIINENTGKFMGYIDTIDFHNVGH